MPKLTSKYPRMNISAPRIVGGSEVFLTLDTQLVEAYFQTRIDLDRADPTPMVRVMKSSPESMSLQIWTHGRVTDGRTGKFRTCFSQFTNNRQNMLKLAKEIERIAMTLPEA